MCARAYMSILNKALEEKQMMKGHLRVRIVNPRVNSVCRSNHPFAFLSSSNVTYFLAQMVTRTKKIFVGGLSANTTVEDVKKYFEQYGKVEDAMLMIDKQTARHRGANRVSSRTEFHLWSPFSRLWICDLGVRGCGG